MSTWRILIVNVTLASRTGTETVVRDLAVGLKAAGQTPMVYAPQLGEIAEEIRSFGIPVVSELSSVPETPDVVHGHHHVETVDALLKFPRARGLFVCHDRLAPMSAPPRMGRILRYVAVDYNCLERLTVEYGIPGHLTRVIYNSVDTSRFVRRLPLPPRPVRALVFSNYAGPGTHLDSVRAACAQLGVPVDVIGSVAGNNSLQPEVILGRYDLVFAKARCALEAMAVGAAVVLCDTTGLGPMVMRSELDDLRRWNFGMRVLRGPLDPTGIVRQVERYDAADATAVSDYVRTHADLRGAVDRYLQLYDELMSEPLANDDRSIHEFSDYVRHMATRIAELETALAQYQQPYRMEPLSDALCSHLTLLIKECPDFAGCGTMVQILVELENGSSKMVGSFPPFPVQLSYRWLRDGTEEIAVAEGSRTPLRPGVPSEGTATYSMRIMAPDEPGRYRVRLTLVQEWVRWLDTLPSPVSAELTLSIVSSLGASSPD